MTFLFNKNSLILRRRQLRSKMTNAELLLWSELKNKKVQGYRFKRQFSIDSFVVDFYCPKLKLVIEVDGNIHLKKEEIKYDDYRQNKLQALGLKVLRFTNDEVINDLKIVLERIKENLFSPPYEGGDKEGVKKKVQKI